MNEPTDRSSSLPKNLWQRDEPLRQAAELMDRLGDSLRAVSFDFFDTIVWRLTGKPTDVFSEVGKRLHAQSALRSPVPAADYETLRRHAEHKTRERQNLTDPKCEDIRLATIYDGLQKVLAQPAAAAEIEHAAECELCLLNPGMVEFIHLARQRGLKVLIISDIYFTADHLRGILRANHLDPALFDFVFTSADESLCKGSGNLFKRALKAMNLKPEQLLHLGDNYHADVLGARRAGVHACHYLQAINDIRTILDREQVLLAGQTPVFSANSLRMLAARYFPNDTAEGFFGRTGALVMGPLMTRFASWACEQYIAAGVHKVGAFMREGDLFAQVLQREAENRGYDLAVKPLFVNRRATDLAALGKLTATSLLDWLERRCTLPIRGILKHFGLSAAQLRGLPFSLDEMADTKEKILKLAEFLFTPEIARHIEAKSAEERGKVMDYLRPWMTDGTALGVCDIGYSASAQSQLYRILELENNPTKLVGCYLVTYERAADRVLEGMDIRHFLGSYGKPDFHFRSFVRAPAFIEQSLVAPMGTTLGYERQPDGTVTPILDRNPFSPEMLRHQQAFKDGVLLFQKLWFHFREAKPQLLNGESEYSRRVLADVDLSLQTVLARATTFPLASEVTHFGAIPLDDNYFADKLKTLCSAKDRETLRQRGYAHILGEAGIHWPQGVHAVENPRSNSEFFSYAKAFLLCKPEHDGDGQQCDVTVFVRALRNPTMLRECLGRVRAIANPALRIELVVATPFGNKELAAVAKEFARQFVRFRVWDIRSNDSANASLNTVADESAAPVILFLQEDTFLPAGWDKPMLDSLQASPQVAAVLPTLQAADNSTGSPTARCLMLRRSAFIESLGFKDELGPDGGTWNVLLHLQDLKWKTVTCPQVIAETKSVLKKNDIHPSDAQFLRQRWPDYLNRIVTISQDVSNPSSPVSIATPCATPVPQAIVNVDWNGSFLDYGSLSQVNRECTKALAATGEIKLQRVASAAHVATKTSATCRALAKSLSTNPSSDVAVTVRHQWPPDWSRPQRGALVVIQPWEFGSLPADWVKASAGVDEFWVPSNYVRQVYVNSGVAADKISVVPNGVDPAQFQPGLTPLPLATNKKFRFLFVGGTIQRKGPDVLLKSYLATFTAADDVCLVIKDFGGQSVYQGQTFEKEIAAARLQPNAPEILYLNNELAPADMPRLYAACHCLVHPYRGEGFGMPVLEAMACGLPVVVTRGGATDDFVPEDAGWFIASQRKSLGRNIGNIPLAGEGWWLEPDAADLSAKLKHVFTHPDEAKTRGNCGAATAVKNYSWARVAELMKVRLQRLATIATPRVAKLKPITKIELPATALVGHVGAAREALKNNRNREAWNLATEAVKARPFHPEAWLTLSEIAFASGATAQGKACLERARQLTPKWKAATAKNTSRHAAKAVIELPALPEISATPRLTVCLIVKNEEQFLERCLQSVRDLAHQIVVVDTGSTDRTVEIAKKFNAEVYTFTWNDDFSAARNEALKHATGDWVLSLDADEELMPEHRQTIVQEMQDAQVMAYRLPIIDEGREREGCSYVPRLFRNAPGLFFIGRVHEQIFSSLEVRAREWNLENRLGKSALLHHGYTREVVASRDKIARNLRLLKLALEELPGEPNLVMNLGLELVRSGQLDAGLEQYREALRLMIALPANQVVPELRETLLTQLTTHLLKAKRFTEIVELWHTPFTRSAGVTASQHFVIGLAYLELKQPAEAAEQMRQCLAKRNLPTLSPVNQEILKAGPQHCLALALAALKHDAAADQAFRGALADDPQSRSVRFDFAKFHFQSSQPVEALKLLNELAQENADDLPVWQSGGQIALSQPEFLEFAQNWTSEAIKNFPEHPAIILQRAEVLLLNQQADEALPLWRKAHAPNSARHLAAITICEFLGGECQRKFNAGDEKLVSQEFLKWYRQLIRFGATSPVSQLNEKLDDLQNILPTVSGVLTAALKQAEAALPA